jgi:prevent-host-death family protein
MDTILTANEAKTRFGELLDAAQREPVRITRHQRVVGVMVSAQDYEAMRAFFANRLQHTMLETGVLSEDEADALLADES